MKKNLFIDQVSENLTLIQKMDFETVDSVFDALDFAFHQNGIDDDEGPDERMLSLWRLFLITVGWTEDEYWNEHHFHYGKCSHCSDEKDVDKTENSSEKNDNKKLN